MEELFLKASKKKLRFETRQGNATVEDLWDYNLESLNGIAQKVNKTLKDSAEESFIAAKPKGNAELELKLEVLKYIISVKLAEADEKKVRAEKQAQAATLKSILEVKKLEQVQALSVEELEKRLAEVLS